MNEKIKAYWEERAEKNKGSLTATTDDIYMRELEINTIVDQLKKLRPKKGARIIDIGCGDGNTLIKISGLFPEFDYTGVDYAEGMIENARTRLQASGMRNLKFVAGDVLELGTQFAGEKFNLVMTDRCLINLESFKLQAKALAEIAGIIDKNGHFLAIENFAEGQDNLTAARLKMGLEPIPVRWHNKFFKEEQFKTACKKHFKAIEILDFSSSYYFATRVLYSAMCKAEGVTPDYAHIIHKLSIDLPWVGCYSPIRMAIMKKR